MRGRDQSCRVARKDRRAHNCEWEDLAKSQLAIIDELKAKQDVLQARLDELEKQLAKRPKPHASERLPSPNAEMDAKKAKDKGGHTNPDERKKRKDARAKLDTIDVLHQIPDDERTCPSCGEACLPIGGGEVSYELEWVPGRFVYKRHVVEKGRCPCKQHYASAPTPERVVPGGLYGPGFIAKLIVDRCGDATPLYRVERERPDELILEEPPDDERWLAARDRVLRATS